MPTDLACHYNTRERRIIPLQAWKANKEQKQSYDVMTIAEKDLQPSLTAFTIAVLSAQVFRG